MAANSESSPQRIIYLLTYSQADLVMYPTRQSFADLVKEAFSLRNVNVIQWVVSLESHDNGGRHYHMALKLDKRCRWLATKRYMLATYGVNINFEEGEEGDTYYTAYQYVTKEDNDFLMSDGHPEMNAVPRTLHAVRRRRGQAARGKGSKRVRMMSEFELVQVVQSRNLKSRVEVMALAARLQSQGNCRLVELLANKGTKCIDNALNLTSELAQANSKLQRKQRSGIEILEAARENGCVEGCEGVWLESAEQVLLQNSIPFSSFATAVYDLLKYGSGKFRNIFVHGPSNCGKSFLLKPIMRIFDTFSNPAHGTFAWVRVDEKEVILLNDFRWSPVIIAWETLLLLLEGDTTHLPAPKNACYRDIELASDTPIFATADMPIVLAKGGTVDPINTRMMEVRWRFFHLWRAIKEEDQKNMEPCSHCFAELIFKNQQL